MKFKIFLSSGQIYFGDINYKLIRKVDTSGTISTVVGNAAMSEADWDAEGAFTPDGAAATSAMLFDPFDDAD